MREGLAAVMQKQRHRLEVAQAHLRGRRTRLKNMEMAIAGLEAESREVLAVTQLWEQRWREAAERGGLGLEHPAWTEPRAQLAAWQDQLRELRHELMAKYCQAQREEIEAAAEVGGMAARLQRLEDALARLRLRHRGRVHAYQEEQAMHALALRRWAERRHRLP
ncbi:hypothetical protein [Eleftheria terrae]|uniref:hypothetical protein n=1 Tax=Eleftheria terrae TaxID=1597781 RepID=UPI00263A72DF|nr:hypothetical protein [Eleftheria terrae]WKB53411.1 hypothetical protein N7L95_03145 [Eleftheria terrae]